MMDHSQTEEEKLLRNNEIERLNNSPENQAILEISSEDYLLKENVEILIHSKHMSNQIFESLLKDKMPIYFYGITTDRLNQEVIILIYFISICISLKYNKI